jgi:hypothetical protein
MGLLLALSAGLDSTRSAPSLSIRAAQAEQLPVNGPAAVLFQQRLAAKTIRYCPFHPDYRRTIQPLRNRVQRFINRRFYRSRYYVAQTLASYAQAARDEVALEALTAELEQVVQETMQPEVLGV